jgi:hypothetical protein
LVDQGIELVRQFFVRAGVLGLLFYASCGGRTTLVDLSEQAAGDGGIGGSTGGVGGKGSGGRGGVGGATGGVGGATGGAGGAGGGPAGTGGIDFCQGEPCRNGGSCYQVNGGWACRCPPGTFGADCSGNVNECDPNRCVNGDCQDLVNGFDCDCYEGFGGLLCEIPLGGDCGPITCLNGGTCVEELGTFRCDCPVGYGGSRCELLLDPCAPNPCQNGGICIDQMGVVVCACPAGFAGDRCQTKVGGECGSSSPCLNGGLCVETGGGDVACQCPAGFSPPFCQCRGDDQPGDDGSCVLRSVCGLPEPEAFASGDCSDNTAEFADWWCQLGGYAEAAAYRTLTSTVLQSHYYDGGLEEVLSACGQVIGPAAYGFQTNCTGVTNLSCKGNIDNALRGQLMVCGNPARDPRTFIPAGASLTVVSGCSPSAATQALMVTRAG